jgi:DNA-directed RNA polymerase subunit alpha
MALQRNWQSLIKPEKLDVEPGADPSRVATVVAEPLERGFGMTLGNATACCTSSARWTACART